MKLILYYIDPGVDRIFIEKTKEDGEKYKVLSSPYNFVSSGEIVARVVDVEDNSDIVHHLDKGYDYYNVEKFSSFKAGESIYFDEFSKSYKASSYGFAVHDSRTGRLKIMPPLKVTRDKMFVYYFVFPTKFKAVPDYKIIEEELMGRGIITLIDKDKIEEELSNISLDKPKLTRITVAKGREPVTGNSEYFVPMLKFDKKAGKVLDDGSIDYKQVDSIIEVKKGQEILRKIPEVKPENGFDVFGDIAVAEVEEKKGYKLGKNIIKGDGNIYISSIDGCVNIEMNRVSVHPVAMIKGNVDYEHGNIDFNGSVHIFGSVLPGFYVKANGDVIIDKNVDDSYVEATGDVTVKLGITGKGSGKVIAGGKVKSNYILNSEVEAVGTIEVEDSIINSRVFSNDMVSVTSGHGKIIGGEVTARHEVIVNVIGTQKENRTSVVVGRSLYVEREIGEIRIEIEKVRSRVDEAIKKIKTSFGEGIFENPKEFLKILPPVKKKNCLLLLKELSDSNKELKELVEKRKIAEEKLKLERDPMVIAHDAIFPGSVITIKKRRKLIEKKIDNVKLYEDMNDRNVKISSAV